MILPLRAALYSSIQQASAARSMAQDQLSGRSLATMASGAFPSVPSFNGNEQSFTLNDGTQHPAIGFGTYKVGFIPASASASASGEEDAGAQGPTARECVTAALEVGYRFLDCAQFYGNEAEVGAAIADSGVDRKNLYLASKVWTSTIYEGADAVKAQVLKTLADLDCDYLDLYCVHWPVPSKHIEAYVALQDLKAQGLIRSLGLSNYAVEDFQELVSDPRVSVRPSVNQIEVNPFLYRQVTLAFFKQQGVLVQSYRALRDGKAFNHPDVQSVAQKHGKTAAQVLGWWCLDKGCVYIPKSVRRSRMEENASVFDFSLDERDLACLDGLTTMENKATFLELYRKCVNRDTPLDGTFQGVKPHITVD
mmetsp:Transcript_53569/g.106271  ORF Transcript_53569/g.106271 Transcript_53569/m.106271 type:complete len:365 (+) Transcript_53569:2-1096(+)